MRTRLLLSTFQRRAVASCVGGCFVICVTLPATHAQNLSRTPEIGGRPIYAAGGVPGRQRPIPKPTPKPIPSPSPTPEPTPKPAVDGETDWKNTGTDFNTASNWTSVTGATPPGAGDVAWFKVVKSTNPNLSASVSIAGLYFSSTASSGYTLSATSPFVLTLTGYATDTSGTEDSNVSAVAIGANNTSGTNIISAPISLAPASGSTSTIFQASGGTLTLSGVISGATTSVGLTKTGGGILNLGGGTADSASNTHTGLTTVSAGTLSLNKAASTNAIAGDILINGGTLNYGTARDDQIADSAKVAISSGSLAFGARLETIGSTGTPTSGLSMSGGSITMSSGTINLSNSIIITGGSMTISAGGTLQANTELNFSGGTIDFSATSGTPVLNLRAGTGTGITYSSSGTTTAQITNSGGLGTVSLNTAAGATTVFNIADSTSVATEMSIAAPITGAGKNLQKTGAGVLVLGGVNTYTGTTVVNSGTLLVNGSLASGSAVTVNAGTIGGSGTINGTVDVKSGATVAPGGSVGILTTGALTLRPGATFLVDLNGGPGALGTGGGGPGTLYDQLAVNGTLTLGGSLSNLLGATPLAIGDKFFIATYSTLSGTFSNVTGTGAAGVYISGVDTFTVDYISSFSGLSAISLTVTAIPEPGTWVGAALTLGAILLSQGRKLRELLAAARS